MSANSELIFYWVHLLKNSIVGFKRKKVPPASKKKTPYIPSSAKFGDKETREEAWRESKQTGRRHPSCLSQQRRAFHVDRHCSSLFHCHRWRGGASSNKLHDITSDYCRLDVLIHTYHLSYSQLCCADDVCNRSFKSSHSSFTHDCVAESRLEN